MARVAKTDGPGGHLLRNLKEIEFTKDRFPLYYGHNFLEYGRSCLYYGWVGGFDTDKMPLPSTSPERYLVKPVMSLGMTWVGYRTGARAGGTLGA